VILAFLSSEDIETYLRTRELQAFTPKTITERARLRADLRRIRIRGYATSSEEVYAGAGGVAAPIFNSTSDVIASLGVSAPLARLPIEKANALAPEVIRRATLVTEALKPR